MSIFQDVVNRLYTNFNNSFPYISIERDVVVNFVKDMGDHVDADDEHVLDLLRDYTLSNDLADEIEL